MLKVGDYVRTKSGFIDKIININDFREPSMKYALEQPSWNDDIVFIGEEDIIKSSPNIIDLIEVGDYVNGNKVYYLKGQVPESDINCKEDVLYTEYVDEYGEWYGYEEDEIETIVTKEQFESMEYKVGEKND